jgi:putative FmdB family regulatory protein
VSTQEKFLGICRFLPVAPNFHEKTRIEEESFCGGNRLPLYEYRCTVCGYSFEKIQSFSAEPERECPKCHGALIRPVTAPALRFAGAGWYVNDYAAKGGAKTADGGGASEGASGDSGSKDAKPAATESSAPAAPAAAASSAPSTASTGS